MDKEFDKNEEEINAFKPRISPTIDGMKKMKIDDLLLFYRLSSGHTGKDFGEFWGVNYSYASLTATIKDNGYEQGWYDKTSAQTMAAQKREINELKLKIKDLQNENDALRIELESYSKASATDSQSIVMLPPDIVHIQRSFPIDVDTWEKWKHIDFSNVSRVAVITVALEDFIAKYIPDGRPMTMIQGISSPEERERKLAKRKAIETKKGRNSDD